MSAGDFSDMRPRLLLLLELYRNAATEETRATLLANCEEVFLRTAWEIAVDLLDNGWEPVRGVVGEGRRLRVVSG